MFMFGQKTENQYGHDPNTGCMMGPGSVASAKPIAPSHAPTVSPSQQWLDMLTKGSTGGSCNTATGGVGGPRNSTPPAGSGLIIALKNIVESVQLSYESGALKEAMQWILWNVLVPFCVAMLVSACIFYVAQKIYRHFHPLTPKELHRQALQTLQSASQRRLNVSNNRDLTKSEKRVVKEQVKAEKCAESLLKTALERDPEFDPALVSLSALYVYRQENPSKALDLIQLRSLKSGSGSSSSSSTKNKPLTPELKAIEEDAKALKQGHKSMVQREMAESEYLSVLAALARD